MKTQEYRQSRKAIIMSYFTYRWMLALLTYGILVIYDILKYRNTKLVVSKDFMNVTTGVLFTKQRQLEYADIQGLDFRKSALGKHNNSGTLHIHLKNESISIKFIPSPSQLANLLHQLAQASGASTKSPEEYEAVKQETKAQKLVSKKAKQEERYDKAGKCPRCGSDKIQAVVEHAVWKGNGWSLTRRICLRCGKKF